MACSTPPIYWSTGIQYLTSSSLNGNFEFSLEQNRKQKQRIYDLLDHLQLDYVRSSTNFIFFHSNRDIRELGPEMLAKGVRIGRPFPPFYDWCRISTGTAEEVDLFIKGMLEVYNG